MRAWYEDLSFAARGLWRSRAFTVAAVLTLAAGAAAAILGGHAGLERPAPAAAGP